MEGIDALLPPEMAKKAEDVGVRKASLDAGRTFALGVLAGVGEPSDHHRRLARNWALVFAGNAAGALGVAGLIALSGQ